MNGVRRVTKGVSGKEFSGNRGLLLDAGNQLLRFGVVTKLIELLLRQLYRLTAGPVITAAAEELALKTGNGEQAEGEHHQGDQRLDERDTCLTGL